MARSQETTVILVIVAVFVALLLAGSAGAMFMSNGMMGGGMMGGGSGNFNIGWLAVTLLLAVVLIAVVFFLMSSRQEGPMVAPAPPIGMMTPAYPVSSVVPAVPEPESPHVSRNQEAAMFKMLDEDEKRLYTLIRERGGEMLQKDIVASGSFSKAKVTRLLDKLESKEIVSRERHGMTNKIRLRTMPPKPSEPA
jgi:uncharacterized membrane protein